jgi:acyl-CoA thioesterase
VFSRGGRVSQPLELQLDTVHSGGSFATLSVTYEQAGKPISTGIVLLHKPDPDLIRHQPAMPPVAGPDDAGTRVEKGPGGQEFGVPAAYDHRGGADDVNPPDLATWYRYPEAPDDETIGQALVAFATNLPSIGIALQPHESFSVEQSHQRMSTGVISHTLTFHEPVLASEWLLYHMMIRGFADTSGSGKARL